MSLRLSAELDGGEAVLRFPYDDALRRLLRTIPGRRWDPRDRSWRVPLDGESAHTLGELFSNLPGEPLLSEELQRALWRKRAGRDRYVCVLDVVRADEDWWLTFASDHGRDLVRALLEHSRACELAPLRRGLIPLDEEGAQLVGRLLAGSDRLQLTEDASHAVTEMLARTGESRSPIGPGGAGESRSPIGPNGAGGARSLIGPGGAGAATVAGGTTAGALAGAAPEPLMRVRPLPWEGTIDVAADGSGKPLFLLLGDLERLPSQLREQAASAPGGASLPLTLSAWRLIQGMRLRAWVTPAARRCLAAVEDGRPAPAAVLEVSALHPTPTFVLAAGHDPAQLALFAALPGALPYEPAATLPRAGAVEHLRLPAIHADPFCVESLDRFIASKDIWIDPRALPLLQEIREQHAHAQGLVELSCATDAALEVAGLGGQLKPFQRAGVSYLLSQRRTFLADEQGLGKTIQALAALQADGAFPAVVVCPASLKLNWQREIERWLPGRSVRVLAGTGKRGAYASDVADVTVVNYEILAARLTALAATRPRALVLDESHYCKNASAKRTQAVARLAAAVPGDGLVVALTGTPVMNRPPELISQLRILGRLADFGSGAQFGRRFRGPDAHMRLHWHLRARCFARRLKSEVLPQLPAKTRSIVPVELSNEAEYRLAEQDVIAWLRSRPLELHELDARVAAALRSERLVRLNALKQIVARGKLHAALAWIHDFTATGEPLVVFAHHREVQNTVMERFPAALHIVQRDSHAARDAAVQAFQEGAHPLIVCSIGVAGQGLTLTRASNVAFLELDWTPAKHEQAEDRCHRIGQTDAVNAWYLLAAGTIDETIAELLERKRAVIGAVTDGRESDEEAIVDALARELAGRPYRHLRAVA